MPPTPRARARARLPVGMAATGDGPSSRVVATPGPRWRSTSASTASRSWGGCGGASRTVAVAILGGQLLPVFEGPMVPRQSRWVGTATPVAGVHALELAALMGGRPDSGWVRASLPSDG